jgi:hypothetical protein
MDKDNDAPIPNAPASEPVELDIDSIDPDELGVSDADLPAGDAASDAAASDGPDAEPDPFDDEGVTEFSRGYVQKLRKEAEQARIQARELEENLGQFLPSVQQALGDYLGNTEHKEAAAKWLSQVLGDEFVATLGGTDPSPAAAPSTDSDDDIVTASEARKLAASEFDRRQEEAAQRAEEKRVAEFLGQRGLGPDADGNPHPHTWDILNRMRKGASLEEAVASYEEGVREYELEIERRAIRKLLDRKKADADASPKVAVAEGGAPELGGFDLTTAAGRRAAAAAVALSRRSRPAT